MKFKKGHRGFWKEKKLSEKHKEKIKKGVIKYWKNHVRKFSEEHKKNLRESFKGRKPSEEHKKKISEALKGHTVSEETRKKIGAGNYGGQNVLISTYRSRARKIMEQHLRIKLETHTVVHHINGNPKDNRIENLQIMTDSKHTSFHQQKRIYNNRDENGRFIKKVMSDE